MQLVPEEQIYVIVLSSLVTNVIYITLRLLHSNRQMHSNSSIILCQESFILCIRCWQLDVQHSSSSITLCQGSLLHQDIHLVPGQVIELLQQVALWVPEKRDWANSGCTDSEYLSLYVGVAASCEVSYIDSFIYHSSKSIPSCSTGIFHPDTVVKLEE